jgi:hypothetical protein
VDANIGVGDVTLRERESALELHPVRLIRLSCQAPGSALCFGHAAAGYSRAA